MKKTWKKSGRNREEIRKNRGAVKKTRQELALLFKRLTQEAELVISIMIWIMINTVMDITAAP